MPTKIKLADKKLKKVETFDHYPNLAVNNEPDIDRKRYEEILPEFLLNIPKN